MSASLLRPLALTTTLLFLVPGWLPAQPWVDLRDWEGKATLVPNPGPGSQFFHLAAVTAWEPDAPRDPHLYVMRVTLPDGQVLSRPLSSLEAAGAHTLGVLVPAAAVVNLPPQRVRIQAVVMDARTGQPVSNVLTGGIGQFPTPTTGTHPVDRGPFGWGIPLAGPSGMARLLPRTGPDGWMFARIPPVGPEPGFFLATTEASNRQVGRRLTRYAPRARRSDEFSLEHPDQPALNLTPQKARAYLEALTAADRAGVSYRLPTHAEWLRAARAGRPTAFWWGNHPAFPRGANFLGPEPSLPGDTTAPCRSPHFEPNPWGLFHTFGNVAEWATTPSRGFVRLGGDFRTEPRSPLPEIPVNRPDALGPDAFVGVRPAFDLTPQSGAQLAQRALTGVSGLEHIGVAFDPDRATVTLTGQVSDPSLRRRADRRLAGLWFVAAVENRLTTPTRPPSVLARLGAVAGPVRRITPLGRRVDEVPVAIRWFAPLPVAGSEWWVNVYSPFGGHSAHKLVEGQPGPSRQITVLVEQPANAAPSPTPAGPFRVALSLGGPAVSPTDPRIVSTVATIALPGPGR